MSDASEVAPNTLLTWSLPRSGAVAAALREWLPRVVQACDPWMSATDIHPGKRWRREVAQQLSSVRVGVLCVTQENLERRWLNYEAGALSVQVQDEARVIPYCLGISPDDCGDPLSDFQGVGADKPGTLQLVKSINAAMDRPIRESDVEAVFEQMWEGLDRLLREIPSSTTPTPERTVREVLDEVLARVKSIEGSPIISDVLPFGRGPYGIDGNTTAALGRFGSPPTLMPSPGQTDTGPRGPARPEASIIARTGSHPPVPGATGPQAPLGMQGVTGAVGPPSK